VGEGLSKKPGRFEVRGFGGTKRSGNGGRPDEKVSRGVNRRSRTKKREIGRGLKRKKVGTKTHTT